MAGYGESKGVKSKADHMTPDDFAELQAMVTAHSP